jgi:hypothetical protein
MKQLIDVRIRSDKWDPKTDDFELVDGTVPDITLYHWSPTVRRSMIHASGLIPGFPSTKGGYVFSYLCFADSASFAWGLSAGMPGSPFLEYDLWQTQLSDLIAPLILPSDSRFTGIHEVRTQSPVTTVWYAGSRWKTL